MANTELNAIDRLRIQEEALRFAQVGLYRYRFDGTLLDMNQAAFEILDLGGRFASPAAVIGLNIEDLIIYTGPRRRVRNLIRMRGGARNVLYPFRTLSGQEKWVVHDSFAVIDPALNEQVVQAIIKDVTADHLREEALRASEERLKRIMETITDAIVIINMEGRFTFANPAAERIFGLSRDTITQRKVGDPAWRLTTLEGRPFHREELAFERAIRTGETVSNLMMAIDRPDGRRVILSVNAAPLRDSTGGIVGVVESLADVTEREQLDRLRDEFLATAAHELKTPVATIKGYAQLLLEWTPGGHDPREGAALVAINRQSDRINRLVQELLEFTRLQQKQFKLQRQVFELGELAAEVVARQRPLHPDHQFVLERKGQAWVNADRDRIDDVLSNLLDNAVKVMPEGGKVSIAVYTQGEMAIAAVTDQGPGIPPESVPHIFEQFYEAHVGTIYDRGGMGIGLYISREIVIRHGGNMWFESTWGKGTTFYLSLPLVKRNP